MTALRKTGRMLLNFSIIGLGIYHLFRSSPMRFHLILNQTNPLNSLSPEKASAIQVSYFLFGLINLVFIYGFIKNRRLSWWMETASLVFGLVVAFLHFIPLDAIAIAFYGLTLLLLIYYRGDFTVRTRGVTKKSVFWFAAIIICFVYGQSLFTVAYYNHLHSLNLGIGDVLTKSVGVLLGDSAIFENAVHQKFFSNYQKLLSFQAIAVVISFLLYILTPVFEKRMNRNEISLDDFVVQYGQNPISYLTLEDDKEIFYGEKVEGLCGYKIVNDVFVICGDMICRKEDGEIFLQEILEYAKRENLDIVFLNVTDFFAEEYKNNGLKSIKCGEDACFLLEEYNLKGKKAAKARASINHANKAGVEVFEYKPLVKKDEKIEEEMKEITEGWLKGKGGILLEFSVGSLSLEKPGSRRYFYALGKDGMEGFVVFTPYDNKKGYLADITRRKAEGVYGVVEKIIYEAFQKMKEEGVLWGNMGLAPLYNVGEESIEAKILNRVYEKENPFYDFKSLHHSKEKYGPTSWESRYYFYKSNNPVKIILAIGRSNYPNDFKKIFDEKFLRKYE